MKYQHASIASILAALALSSPASAAFITIDDSNPDTITITAGDFEGGFSIDGTELTSGAGNSNSVTLADGAFSISGSWFDLGGSGDVGVYFAHADDPVWVTSGLEFFTSTDGILASLSGSIGAYTASFYFPTLAVTHLQNGQTISAATSFLSVAFTSEAPEPASLALLGAGIAGLGLVRRRKTLA